MNINFFKTWSVDGVPTNPDGMTIGVYDNTLASQVVPDGTAMINVTTGNYKYTYNAAIQGHVYTATIVTSVGPQQVSSQQVVLAAGSTPGTNPPVSGSTGYAAVLQQQLSDVTAAKTGALLAISAALTAGVGPNYSIASNGGTENINMEGFLRYLKDQVREFCGLERMILEMLQDLQPYRINQRVCTPHRLY